MSDHTEDCSCFDDGSMSDIFDNNLLQTLRDFDPAGEPPETRGKRWHNGELIPDVCNGPATSTPEARTGVPPTTGEGTASGERGDAHSGIVRTTLQITMDPDIRGGEPCITGTRVPVLQVVGLLADGVAPERIRDYYPSVEIRDTSTGPIPWIGTDNSQPTVMCDCSETPVMWIDGHSVWDVWQVASGHECEAS